MSDAGAAPARTTVGKVSFVVPGDWLAQPPDGEARAFVLPGPGGAQAGLVSLQRVGPLPREGPPLEERVKAAGQAAGKALGVTQVGPPARLVLGTVPAMLVSLPPCGLAAGLLVDGEVVLVIALWASEAAFKAVNALTASARPALAPAPLPPLGEARRATLLGAELPSPAAWLEGPACVAPNRGAWWIPRTLLGCSAPARYGAVVEVQPEPAFALGQAALRFVRDACQALGRALEADERRVRVVGSSELALPDGSIVATVIVDERDGGAVQTRCVAHARATAKATYLAAVAIGPWSEGWPAGAPADRVLEKVDDVAESLLAVIAQARALPLPPVDAAATARLVAKGRWSRRSEWSDSMSSPSLVGPGNFSAFSRGHEAEAWTFAPDGTCEVETSSSSAVSAYDTFQAPGGEPFHYSPALGLWREPMGKRAHRYEVRAGTPLVLVLRDASPGGRVTVHALDLEAKGTYGKTETHGVAIDGRIEGTYKSASGSLGSFESWSP